MLDLADLGPARINCSTKPIFQRILVQILNLSPHGLAARIMEKNDHTFFAEQINGPLHLLLLGLFCLFLQFLLLYDGRMAGIV